MRQDLPPLTKSQARHSTLWVRMVKDELTASLLTLTMESVEPSSSRISDRLWERSMGSPRGSAVSLGSNINMGLLSSSFYTQQNNQAAVYTMPQYINSYMLTVKPCQTCWFHLFVLVSFQFNFLIKLVKLMKEKVLQGSYKALKSNHFL